MKKLLLFILFLIVTTVCKVYAQEIQISSSDRFAYIVLSESDYNDWIAERLQVNRYHEDNILLTKYTKNIYNTFNDEFDFILICSNGEENFSTTAAAWNRTVRQPTKGLEPKDKTNKYFPSDWSLIYGSNHKLQGVIEFNYRESIAYGFLHEFAHNWGNYAFPTYEFNGTLTKSHWGVFGSNDYGQLGGFKYSDLERNVDGLHNKFRVRNFNETYNTQTNSNKYLPYSNLELYLMGFIPASEVTDFSIFRDINVLDRNGSITFTATETVYNSNDLTRILGDRDPDYTKSQKDFTGILLVVSNHELTETECASYDEQIAKITYVGNDNDDSFTNFYEATLGLGTFKIGDLSKSIKKKKNISYYLDGEFYKKVECTVGEKISLIDVPKKDGCPFGRWKCNYEIMPDEDIEIYGNYLYTITFDTDGGEPIEPIVAEYNSKIELPTDVKKIGYSFVMWSDLIWTMPAQNISIKAQWIPNLYTLSLNANGGGEGDYQTPLIPSQSSVYGAKIDKPKNMTRRGYKFMGWKPEIPETMPAEDLICEAQWEIINYDIEYQLDGGVNPNNNPSSYTVECDEITLSDPTRIGYKFIGWQEGKVIGKQSVGNKTFTALWEPLEFTITFIVDGKEFERTYTYGTDYPSLEEDKLKKESTAEYTFLFADWSPKITTVTKDAVYTAQFFTIKRKYIITFVVDDVKTEKEFEYGDTPSYGLANPTKEATAEYTYKFDCWSPVIGKVDGNQTYTAQFSKTKRKYTISFDVDGVKYEREFEYGTTKPYLEEDKLKKESTAEWAYNFANWSPEISEVTGEQTYTALFTPIKRRYTVTYIVDGKPYGNPDSIEFGKTIKEPKKDDYIFNGWYKDENFEYKWNFEEDVIKKNMTLYAKLNPDPATSISEADNKRLLFKVFPNPTTDMIKVEGNNYMSNRYSIYSLIGGNVKSGLIKDTITEIDVSSLPSGIYVIKIGNQTAKFVKQ